MISEAQRTFRPIVTRESFILVSAVIFAGVILTIFQDYLFTARHNSSFVFYESLLFKCVWLVFIPAYLWAHTAFDKLKRMSYQKLILLYGVLVVSHIFISTVMVWAISGVFKEQGYGFTKILLFTLSNDSATILLIYFVALVYLKGFHKSSVNIVQAHKIQAASESQPVKPQVKERLLIKESLQIKNGKHNHLVMFNSILCIKTDSPYVIVQTEENSYLHSSSLRQVADELDSRFFKLHRSCIANIDKVVSYHSRLNGDYDVTLSGGIQVRLSRNYARQFKKVIGDM